MNVVVVEEIAGEYEELLKQIRAMGFTTSAISPLDAPALVSSEAPDILVVGCRGAVAHLTTLSRLLGSSASFEYRGLIAVVDGDTATARAAAEDGGAGELLLCGGSTPQILDHVKSSAQIVTLERKLRERVVELEGALRRLSLAAAVRGGGVAAAAPVENRGGIRFLLTRSWTKVDDILRAMCSEYLQHKFEPVSGAFTIPPDCAAASISLTDVENELALELTFLTSTDSARDVASMFTGDASMVDDDVVRDVLLELANSGMGAVRAAFLTEEFRFAASTPKASLNRPVSMLVDRVEAKRTLTFRCGETLVHVVVAVRTQARTRLPASQLKEGMVIAADIKNEAGVLLVRAGTRLTETSASRIARTIPTLVVELAEAA